jgi:dTMP kinase
VEEVARVNEFATGGLAPDLTVLLDVTPAAAAARAGVEVDRFEEEGAGLQESVRDAYESLVAADPGRWVRVAADRPPDAVHEDVLAAVERVLAGASA